jgi:undecaprenyl-diphosphatase
MAAWLMRIGDYDRLVLNAVLFRRHRILDRLMRLLTHLGDAVVVISATAGLVFQAGPDLEPAGAQAAFALAASHALVQLLKRTIVRPRPQLPPGMSSLVAPPDRFSFPSGHAAASMSLSLALAAALPTPIALILLSVAAIVGLSRCYLGVHYPGDVLVGWTLAALAVMAAPYALPLLGLA